VLHKWIEQLLQLERNCGIMQLIMIMLKLSRARVFVVYFCLAVCVGDICDLCYFLVMSGIYSYLIFCRCVLCVGLYC
jgi:hypothetical protein